MDGSVTPALILDNGSKLIVSVIWISNGLGTKGQIGIRDGATLEVRGKFLDVGNDGDSGLNVSNGNLIVKNYLRIGVGKYASGEMTVSGKSSITVGKDLILSESYSAKSQLTVNDGTIKVNGKITLGGSTGTCRVFLKGGVLKGENLIFKNKLSKVIYTGGKLLINAKKLSEADMKKLIDNGNIDVSGAKDWKITTIDGYTALVPK